MNLYFSFKTKKRFIKFEFYQINTLGPEKNKVYTHRLDKIDQQIYTKSRVAVYILYTLRTYLQSTPFWTY